MDIPNNWEDHHEHECQRREVFARDGHERWMDSFADEPTPEYGERKLEIKCEC